MLKSVISSVFICFLVSNDLFSQDLYKDKKWDVRIVPELYAPFVTGDVTFSGNRASLEQSLNYGGLLGLHVESEKWFFVVNYADIGFKSDFKLPISDRKGNFTGKYGLMGFFATRKVTKWLKAGLGGRLLSVNHDLNFEGELLKDSDWSFLSPLVVLNFYFLHTEKWRIKMGTDVGGFGFFDSWTYYFHPKAGYRVSKLLEVALGARYLSLSFKSDELLVNTDIELYGLDVGVVFHF